MDKKTFILKLEEGLELETELTDTTLIKELDEWDSMAVMVLIGIVYEEFAVSLNGDDIEAITTVESLLNRIGLEKFK